MRSVFCVLMMILSLLIGFQQAIIVVHFKLNQAAIEQQFCVNKDKPQLHCHGICHLKKQLQETENTDTASLNIFQRVDMLPITIFKFEAYKLSIELLCTPSIYKEIPYTDPYLEIFVPPPLV
ncbi:hypothetical protein [Sphingobacterium sp. SYP-B4668]|uniref:hypothetical protein n=1 Tax=Sphingobacterium sp. SYP-B4668 TaxID=2996035 RepID=UPI0022DE84CD|nr:hypothetical protein [Sphingobacterium sp. SYP-B4668]